MTTADPCIHPRKRPRPAPKPLSVRLTDAPAIVGISVRGLAGMIADGRLRAVRRGRIVLIPYAELERLAGEDGAA